MSIASGWQRVDECVFPHKNPVSMPATNLDNLPNPTTPQQCVARFIYNVGGLNPWIGEAGGIEELIKKLVIKTRWKVNKNTKQRYLSALASPNLRYCPIYKAIHKSARPYMIINAKHGSVTVWCMAEKCNGHKYRPMIAMLPEHLKIIFSSINGNTQSKTPHAPSATDAAAHSKRKATNFKNKTNPKNQKT